MSIIDCSNGDTITINNPVAKKAANPDSASVEKIVVSFYETVSERLAFYVEKSAFINNSACGSLILLISCSPIDDCEDTITTPYEDTEQYIKIAFVPSLDP